MRRRSSPQEIITEEFLKPLGMTPSGLADCMAKGDAALRRKFYRAIKGDVEIDRQVAKRLAEYFDTTQRFWLNIQANYNESN